MSDLISRKWLMECVDEGWIKFDTEKDKNIYVHLVRDIAPSAQPEIVRCKDCKLFGNSEHLPSAQPEERTNKRTETHACDLIDRRMAIDEITEYSSGNSIYMSVGELKRRIEALPSAQQWIPCSERMPECEQEVLICTKKIIHISKNSGLEWYEEPIITSALYEDGTMLEVNSKWRWEDIDYAGWDEKEDCGIIPEGWWENRHFNHDDVYNNIVDKEVVAWMPLPEPYTERREE